MPTFSRVFLVVLVAVLLAAAQQRSTAPASGEFEWRVQLKQDTVAPSNIEAVNKCKKTHRFQVDPQSLPFMRLKGDASFSVRARSQHQVPVEFDTRNMNPGQYEALVRVNCLTCRSEIGCTEDHQNLHVFLTVLSAAPNWSNVHPEQKGPVSTNPALRWSNVSPERKRQ